MICKKERKWMGIKCIIYLKKYESGVKDQGESIVTFILEKGDIAVPMLAVSELTFNWMVMSAFGMSYPTKGRITMDEVSEGVGSEVQGIFPKFWLKSSVN